MQKKNKSQYFDKMKAIEKELINNNWIKAVKFDKEYPNSDSIIGSNWSRYARRTVKDFKFTIQKKYDRIYFVSTNNNALELFNKEFDEIRSNRVQKSTKNNQKSKEESILELMELPGVGKAIASELYSIGITKVEDLKGKDAEKLFEKLNKNTSSMDRNILYVFRCCVYYANNSEDKREAKKLKWWYWKNVE